tara:strand:+ start:128 stop:385 length:258 start_codon:yes stop_codon:yes gene_type:complete
MKKYILLLVFVVSLIIPLPVHAYAGPGVAIAAILVFITVIISFFASIFLKSYRILKLWISNITSFFKSYTISKNKSKSKLNKKER